MPLMSAAIRHFGYRTLIGLLTLLPVGAVQAQLYSCSATMSSVTYGAYTPWGGNVDVTGTLTSSCTFSLLGLLAGVTVCYTINTGTHPEVMSDGIGHTLNHELYLDASRSTIWGDGVGGTSQITVNVSSLHLGTVSLPTQTIYARLAGNQPSPIPNVYTQGFLGSATRIAWKGGLLGPPGNCTGPDGTAQFPFTASATVAAQCDSGLTTSTLDFGATSLLNVNIDATAAIGPRCTNSTPYQIGLDNGQNASGSTRRMKNGSSFISYELYRDSGRTQRWGNTLFVDTVSATGTGSSQSNTVYGRVAPQTTPVAGSYTDTVLVTVTY